MPEFSDVDLCDIQGMILSGYGHLRYGAYLFLQMRDAAAAKRWLAELIPQLSTAERWERLPDGSKLKPVTSLNVAFTHPGLQTLGLAEEALWSLEREFIWGMPRRAAALGDTGESAPETWEVGGPNNPQVHAVLILNAVDESTIDQHRAQQRALLDGTNGGVVEINEQHGHRPLNDKEPFGYHDGVAQPKILRMPGYPERVGNVVATGEFVLGYENESALYAPSPWLYPEHDPNNMLPTFPMGSGPLDGKRDFGKHGTYLVYRKLAQDVAGFWNYFTDQTRRNGGPRNIDETIFLASKCIGRWPSGAPLALAPEKDDPELGNDDARNDNFYYFEHDREGYACPVSSHIRRANPRDSRVREPDRKFALASSDKHRIIRRAVSFGNDLFPRDDVEYGKIPEKLEDDGQARGIHFFAINASIRTQFEFVQVTWCRNAVFDGLNNNKDPIIGDNDCSGAMQIPRKPVRRLLLNMPRFVSVRGGAYFFLPSMTALNYLAQLP